MRSGRRSPIALEIGTREVRAVQLAPGRTRERLAAWARVPRREGAWSKDEARELWSTLCRQGFEGRQVLLVMPAKDATACLLEFRGQSARDVDGVAVQQELSRIYRVDATLFEHCAWKAQGAGRGPMAASWLAVCTLHERAEALALPMDALGLQIVGIDAGCFALARAIAPDLPASSLGLAVHLSHECARFVAMVDSGVVYERVLSGLGWARVLERAQAQFSWKESQAMELLRAMSIAEARRPGVQASVVRLRPLVDEHMRLITHELRHSLNYLEGGYANLPLVGITLTGQGAAIGGWSNVVRSATGAHVRVASARDLVDCVGPLDDEIGSDLTLAIGLARHPVHEEAVA